jgi:hypothetical protein
VQSATCILLFQVIAVSCRIYLSATWLRPEQEQQAAKWSQWKRASTMVNFKILMRPELRAHYERIDNEIARLFNLTTPFLARALIKHVRAARARHPSLLQRDAEIGNRSASTFAWDIVPEICHRMGDMSTVEGERSPQVRCMNDRDFRNHAGYFIMSSSSIISDNHKRAPTNDDLDPLEVLTHDVANGNPVAFALDRIVPAESFDKKDPVSRYTMEISANRGFSPPHLMWTPEMQGYDELAGGLALGL